MTLAQYPITKQRSIEKHLKAAFEATGLLIQALTHVNYQDELDARDAYVLLKAIMERRGLVKTRPKPTSIKTH